MKKIAVKLFFLLALFTVSAFYTAAQTINVTGSLEESPVKRGATGKGSIVLSIPKELHINSNKPTSEFMIPTKVALSGKNIKISKITYPKGKDRKFDFSEEAINVYEGKTTIKFVFTVPKNIKGKEINIRALVSYQACTNELCYPPQKREVLLKGAVSGER
jgi:thiol:disulfide interchange protein